MIGRRGKEPLNTSRNGGEGDRVGIPQTED